MENIIKRQCINTKLVNGILKWSFMILAVLALSFVAGCRLFTVGG